MWFDTHCHFDFPEFAPQLEHYRQQMRQHHVARIFVPSVSEENWERVLTLANEEGVYIGVGIHPCYLNQAHQPVEQLLECLCSFIERHLPQINGIGECGLDKRYQQTAMKQMELFEGQVYLAKRFQRPLVIHSVKRHHHIAELLEQIGGIHQGVIHGFSGNYQQAKRFIDLGLKIGVGGVITWPTAHKTRQAIRHLPIESIVLETDAPDMKLHRDPDNFNAPHKIPAIFECLATLREESPAILASQIWQNSNQLYST